MTIRNIRRLLIAVGLLGIPTIALAANDPIPGVDIIVKKDCRPRECPPGIAANTDSHGRFTARIAEPGSYQIWSDCRSRRAPRPCPARTLTLRATGAEPRRAADGSYTVTVPRGRAVVLTGMVRTPDAAPR